MDQTYLVDGQEFYSDTGRPVWPHRHRELPDMKTGQPKGPLKDDSFVLSILKRLDDLEMQTRASNDAKGKDLAALKALDLAAWLTRHIAGWAIDHQLGLAHEDLRFVPLQPTQTKDHPEYLEQLAEVDSHEHERRAGRLNLAEVSPEVARRFVRNVLSAMHHKLALPYDFVEALDALDFGETLPILREAETATRLGLKELRLKLYAVMYVEFQYSAIGVRKHKSQELIADRFGVSADSVRGWPTELRQTLGHLEVSRSIASAKNYASSYLADLKKQAAGEPADAAHFLDMYSLDAVTNVGKQYRMRNR